MAFSLASRNPSVRATKKFPRQSLLVSVSWQKLMRYSCILRTLACRSICWQQTLHRGAHELPQCEIRLEEHKAVLKLPCARSGFWWPQSLH